MVGSCEAQCHFRVNYSQHFQYISQNAFPWAIIGITRGKELPCQISLKNMGLINTKQYVFRVFFNTFNMIKCTVTLAMGYFICCFLNVFDNRTHFWKNIYLVRVQAETHFWKKIYLVRLQTAIFKLFPFFLSQETTASPWNKYFLK